MGSGLLRTIQILVATILFAFATISIMWVPGVIDLAAAQLSAYRIGGVLGICLAIAVGLAAMFGISDKQPKD
jgi:hypothetical protein